MPLATAGHPSQWHGVTVLTTEVRLTLAEVGELLGPFPPFAARLPDAKIWKIRVEGDHALSDTGAGQRPK